MFKKFGFVFAVASIIALTGCGGNGGGGGTGGGGSNLTLSYRLKGISGFVVNDVTASATPQTVRIDTGSGTETISNVIVGTNVSSGDSATILSEGSQVLNASIPNASAGATIGGTSIHVPISSSGVLQASVLGASTTPDQVVIATPPATWNGASLPNGVTVLFQSSHNGHLDAAVSGSIATSSAQQSSGSLSVTYSAPSISAVQAAFTGGNSFVNVTGSTSSAGTGTYQASWTSFAKASSYTTANVGAAF